MKIVHADVRMAEDDDLYPLVDLAIRANADSNYNLPFDVDNATKYTWESMKCEGSAVAVAVLDEEVIGFVSMTTSLEYHKQPFCYMTKFWVLPEGKGTDAARQLMALLVGWAEDNDCTHIFTTATAELDAVSQQLFINLVKKTGFSDVGPVLSRIMEPVL
tara:strand:+ start:461 stop:940 length:480 start_codon:yes stop_codon:yes gene_type:complete